MRRAGAAALGGEYVRAAGQRTVNKSVSEQHERGAASNYNRGAGSLERGRGAVGRRSRAGSRTATRTGEPCTVRRARVPIVAEQRSKHLD